MASPDPAVGNVVCLLIGAFIGGLGVADVWLYTNNRREQRPGPQRDPFAEIHKVEGDFSRDVRQAARDYVDEELRQERGRYVP